MNRILVLGAGVSGLAAARLAASRGLSVTIFESNPTSEALGSGFGMASGPWDHLLLTGVDVVVASPGFSERSLPIVETLESGLPIWSEIEFASRFISVPMVAITGTNGKTTVTEATSQMLIESGLNAPATGNIGDPLSDFAGDPYDALVVETSSFQLRFIESFHPVAAAITNIAVDHLDWHGSEAAYRDAKRRIYLNQTTDDLLVFDAEDSGATEIAGGAPGHRFPVSASRLPDGGGGLDDGRLVVGDVSVDLSLLPKADPTHLTNLAMAAALALWMGAEPSAVARAAIEYRPGSHRREIVLEAGGVSWIDDSKATNPHAAISSIRGHGSVILIAGGLAKGTDVGAIAQEPNLKAVLGIGEAGPQIVDAAG
ncbi:MAG: UDP-N-acetylmuramoyl-L-alanine--D-glutamate ligase, partial [Acidimicrobiia bacterium]|nr:UDP-N-acetylmuramoyl-L-alanine--D-glutamate ligase [Acidimicrobiia bacterium]